MQKSRKITSKNLSMPTVRRGRRRATDGRGLAAPNAGRVRRQPDPERQDGALAADRRNDLGYGRARHLRAGVAVANAVYNACGARVRDYPITLDKVLPALMRG